MSIRFKFRSSAIFDSVDLEGRPSISVRELRLKIIRNKNLNVCQDFDLVFSDSVTGEEYSDENFQIPSGACIIVKRVPAGTLPSANTTRAVMINDFAKKASDYFNPASVKVDDVDDFGTDMCLPIEKPLYLLDHESNKGNCCGSDNAGLPGSRFDCQNPGSSDLSQAIYKVSGSNHSVGEQNLAREATGEWKFKKEPANLPVEFKCPLCTTFFKEAVLIPCCQHSFCKKCISFVLLEKKICPICFSIKCKVDDLLPNLSLRQAIEHFFGSHVLDTGSPNDLCQLVPDGESGIQAREISCAVTVIQRQSDSPHSPSATGHGSNQVLADSFYHRRSTPHKMHMFDGKRSQYAHLNPHGGADDVPITVFDGGNQPLNLCKTRAHDEGAETKFWATGRHKQGGRTCYICGSPEHLMRDCPASNSLTMPQTGHHMLMGGMPGYPPPYWNNTMYSPISPFTHIYGNPEMMPFRAPIIPPPTFCASPYMPYMQSGVPLNGVLRKEGMAPLTGTKTGHLLNQKEFMESEQPSNRKNVSNQNLDKFRGKQCYSKYDKNAKERVEYRPPAKDRESSTSNSDDTFGRISKRKRQHVDQKRERSPHSFSAGRERALLHTERSISSLEDKCEHHHRDTRKPHERRGHGSDSSWGRHHVPKEESSRDLRHNNRLNSKDHGNELHSGRRTIVDGLYEDFRSEYHHHKRKRTN